MTRLHWCIEKPCRGPSLPRALHSHTNTHSTTIKKNTLHRRDTQYYPFLLTTSPLSTLLLSPPPQRNTTLPLNTILLSGCHSPPRLARPRKSPSGTSQVAIVEAYTVGQTPSPGRSRSALAPPPWSPRAGPPDSPPGTPFPPCTPSPGDTKRLPRPPS